MSNDEITRLIGKIRERYDRVQEPSGKIVRIEIDLLQADIRELYEKIAVLSVPGLIAGIPQSAVPEPEIVEEEGPLLNEPVHESEFAQGQAKIPVLVEEESVPEETAPKMEIPEFFAPRQIIPETMPEFFPPAPVAELIRETETPKVIVPPVEPAIPAQRPASEPTPSVQIHETSPPVHSTLDLFGAPTTTLADKFRDEKRSVSEKLHMETSADKSIGSKLRLKITDLRSAIGINDRFIFINELFEGDMRLYDDMLGRLNGCASLGEAIAIFNNTKAQQGWSDELSSVERLLDFIHRRYA